MSEVTRIDPSDLVLLVLGAPTKHPEQQDRCAGITRLEKLVFLLDAETEFRELAHEPADDLHFKPFHYGPYSREVYDAVDLLVAIGLVNERRTSSTSSLDAAEELRQLEPLEFGVVGADPDKPYVERRFELSDKGRYVASVLTERIGRGAAEQITAVKDRYGGLPLRQLLRQVYRAHPEMTTRSRIKDSL